MDHTNEFLVKKMSEVLGVGRSSYYDWLKNKEAYTKKADELNVQITTIFEKSRLTYGSPRGHIELQKNNICVSESTVARRMKSLCITPRLKKKFKNTTNSNHDKKISPNLLKREFSADVIGKKWVSDITYIRVMNSFVYLTTIIDLADRMVIGWSLSNNMTDQDTVIDAFEKAVKNRPLSPGLIFHSDRGSQYASNEFRELLNREKCNQSMSRKGNCWDNAVTESFFKTIKVESLYRYNFENSQQVYSVIFYFIDGWYNTKRIHSSLNGNSPSEMSEILAVKLAA